MVVLTFDLFILPVLGSAYSLVIFKYVSPSKFSDRNPNDFIFEIIFSKEIFVMGL